MQFSAITSALLLVSATNLIGQTEATKVGFGIFTGGLGQTRPVPGSLCPCFQLDDLIASFSGVPLEYCQSGLLAEDFSSSDNRACTGSFCRGGTSHCAYTVRDTELFIDNISQQEEEHCFVNLDTFCAVYAYEPTPSPTRRQTKAPTDKPTTAPTRAPTDTPTTTPTPNPTQSPTSKPSSAPTTESPSQSPSSKPSSTPTTDSPTTAPTRAQSAAPTTEPTRLRTVAPTRAPTDAPTQLRTVAPTPEASPAPSSA